MSYKRGTLYTGMNKWLQLMKIISIDNYNVTVYLQCGSWFNKDKGKSMIIYEATFNSIYLFIIIIIEDVLSNFGMILQDTTCVDTHIVRKRRSEWPFSAEIWFTLISLTLNLLHLPRIKIRVE